MNEPVDQAVSRLRALDRAQQRHPQLGFVVAVVKKFADDGAGQLAALISYYAFFALFPLLLVMVGALGLALQGDVGLQRRILNSSFAQFPIVGDELHRNVGHLPGGGVAIAIGVAGSLLAGFGLTEAIRTAMDRVWDVQRDRRDSWVQARLRGLLVLIVLGLFAIASAVLSGLVDAGAPNGVFAALGLVILSGALSLGVFLAVFALLTSYRASARELLPGALVATLGWQVLQHLGGWLVHRELSHANAIAGVFGTVLGLLFWISLGAQLTILAAEVNVVRTRRLWPRPIL